jgi:hypothetical protein
MFQAWGSTADVVGGAASCVPARAPAWSRAVKMTPERMAAKRVTAERVTAGRTAGRTTAGSVAADGVEKRAEPDWKLALSLAEGVG